MSSKDKGIQSEVLFSYSSSQRGSAEKKLQLRGEGEWSELQKIKKKNQKTKSNLYLVKKEKDHSCRYCF